MLRITSSINPLRSLVFTSVLLCPVFSAVSLATEQPPILEFEPNCAPTIVSTETLFKVLSPSESSGQTEISVASTTLLQQMRQLAADKKADALIIRQLAAKSRKSLVPNAVPQRRLTLVADLIHFCSDDTSLSDRTTLFDKNGNKSFTLPSLKLSLHTPATFSAEPQQVLPQPRRVVSLQQGAYGLLPGMTQTEVLELAGPPDIQITLKTGHKAWAYGRYLWLILDDRLQQIHYRAQVLSGYGINLAEMSTQFERVWQLDGKLPQRTALAKVKRYLTEQKQDHQSTDSTELLLQNNKHQLMLNFELHQADMAQPAVPLLTEFSLYPKDQKKIALEPLQLDWQPLLPLLSVLAPNQQQQKPQLSRLTALLASPHFQVIERKDKNWLVFGDYLQLHIKNNEVQELRLTPAFSELNANKALPLALLHALDLPDNGQQLKQQYPHAQRFADKVLLQLQQDLSSQSIEVLIDPDSPDEKIEQLSIRYY
ncbi:hypothetical protein [Rheinheimera sp.]|uniref:hypothetical protein n=1 Tax=Rheinheimera sp. TaxID=1869214 RepID=UPI002FDEDED8